MLAARRIDGVARVRRRRARGLPAAFPCLFGFAAVLEGRADVGAARPEGGWWSSPLPYPFALRQQGQFARRLILVAVLRADFVKIRVQLSS